MAECLERGNRILTCGNGGIDVRQAMHLAQELSGPLRGQRRALAPSRISNRSF